MLYEYSSATINILATIIFHVGNIKIFFLISSFIIKNSNKYNS